MISRRHFIAHSGLWGATSILGCSTLPTAAASSDYRSLVVLYLNGGNDGNNLLVPTDGAYGDYETARSSLALPKNSLVNLQGSAAGHTFGVHPSLANIAPLYNRRRLAFISNVGPLVEPATAAQVLSNSVRVPPFLLSHSDQQAIVQGWTASEDNSGWAGRGLEKLDSNLRTPLAAVTMDTNRTLVLGKASNVTFMPPGGTRNWGPVDIAYPERSAAQTLFTMARWQFGNAYEAEYARTMGGALSDSTRLVQAFQAAPNPSADFGMDYLGNNMRSLAAVLPIFKSQGLKRQVFLSHWGGFDTHSNQRGNTPGTQDSQFTTLAQVLSAFDATNVANGLDGNVITLVMSEFGRTLRPGSGGGSEHAWGSHWMLIGGPVIGGTVHGTFPTLALGGPDDGDGGRNGRLVPTISSDQVGATLMQWLGMDPAYHNEVFPNLVNFSRKTLPMIQG